MSFQSETINQPLISKLTLAWRCSSICYSNYSLVKAITTYFIHLSQIQELSKIKWLCSCFPLSILFWGAINIWNFHNLFSIKKKKGRKFKFRGTNADPIKRKCISNRRTAPLLQGTISSEFHTINLTEKGPWQRWFFLS